MTRNELTEEEKAFLYSMLENYIKSDEYDLSEYIEHGATINNILLKLR
jgi:hypothetical protein